MDRRAGGTEQVVPSAQQSFGDLPGTMHYHAYCDVAETEPVRTTLSRDRTRDYRQKGWVIDMGIFSRMALVGVACLTMIACTGEPGERSLGAACENGLSQARYELRQARASGIGDSVKWGKGRSTDRSSPGSGRLRRVSELRYQGS